MTDTDEIARLRALWCEEKSKAMTFHAEVERLRAEVDALKAERDEAREQLRLANIDQFNSEAEVAALKAQHDPLAEMWRELSEYQEQADRDGHGESWRRMCEKRTEEATAAAEEDAWDRAAHGEAAASAAVDAAAAWAELAAAAVTAIAAIRKAKEVQP